MFGFSLVELKLRDYLLNLQLDSSSLTSVTLAWDINASGKNQGQVLIGNDSFDS